MVKKWSIRTQEIRNLFFRMKLLLNITIDKLSKYLDIHKSSLYRWLRKGPEKPENITRSIGYNKKLKDDIKDDLIQFICCNNTLTLEEISTHIHNNYGIKVSITTVHRFCSSNNITYKKGTILYSESDFSQIENFLTNINQENLDKYIAIDESSFMLNHSKIYGRSIKGQKAYIIKPGNRIKRYSLIIAMSSNQIIKWELIEGSFDSVKFRSFILGLPNNNILVLDNARIHHATKSLSDKKLSTIQEVCSNKNLLTKYLPPYTPKLNSVEYCFNMIKSFINKKKPRSFQELKDNINIAIEMISANICKSIINKIWFSKSLKS